MTKPNAQRVFLTAPNRVERFFVGGEKLDAWQRVPAEKAYGDSTFSEELLINTTPYIGPGKPPLMGLSLVEGANRTLREMIAEDPEGFLGKSISAAHNQECPVLCKAGDSTGRLILQYHPTRDFARRYLSASFGKTEAWYMLGFRDPKECDCYVGFRPGVTRERFEALVKKDDVKGMLECIHKVRCLPGEVVLVPAGMIHAMGRGTTFVEVHESCDYTLRFERDNYGRPMKDEDMHQGMGFEALFDGLDFTTYTPEEIRKKVRFSPCLQEAGDGWQLFGLLPWGACPEFSMEKLALQKEYALPDSESYCMLIALEGELRVSGITIPRGRAAFVPAAAKGVQLSAENAEALIIRPSFDFAAMGGS